MHDILTDYLNKPLTQNRLEDAAKSLAHTQQWPLYILLEGTLGSGKSTFSRAFIRALTTPTTPVPSPTFTLFQTYDTVRGPLIHADLYRLNHSDEVFETGLCEYFEDGISTCLVEWPDRLPHDITSHMMTLFFEYGDHEDHRIIRRERKSS